MPLLADILQMLWFEMLPDECSKGSYVCSVSRKVVKAGGYNMVKCGPDQEVGIRLPVDKKKITVPCRVFNRGYSGHPYSGEGGEPLVQRG